MTTISSTRGGSPERRDFSDPDSDGAARLVQLHTKIGIEVCELFLSFNFDDPLRKPQMGEDDNWEVLIEAILRQNKKTVVPDVCKKFEEGRKLMLIQESIINRYFDSQFENLSFIYGLNLVASALKTLRPLLGEAEPQVTAPTMVGDRMIQAEDVMGFSEMTEEENF